MTIENIEIFEKLAKSPCYDLKINELVDDLPLNIREALLKADSNEARKILADRERFSDFHLVTCVGAISVEATIS